MSLGASTLKVKGPDAEKAESTEGNHDNYAGTNNPATSHLNFQRNTYQPHTYQQHGREEWGHKSNSR